MRRVLVVDNDPAKAECLARGLRRSGYESDYVHTGREALRGHYNADLLVLSLELPDMDGVKACREIRMVSDVPVIAVTDRHTELDRVLGLQAGADDCLNSPYGFPELLARIEAVTRRSESGLPAPQTIELAPLSIDNRTREVRKGSEPVDLTPKEFDLLWLLASHPNAVVSRRQLMVQVWGRTYLGNSRFRTLDTHINSLRHKLGASTWIVTVHGVGFRLGHG